MCTTKTVWCITLLLHGPSAPKSLQKKKPYIRQMSASTQGEEKHHWMVGIRH